VPFEVGIAILNCGHLPPFEKPAEWTAQVLAFLKG
jgi:pimeloyl-ACP methyl ester carboxylesterase